MDRLENGWRVLSFPGVILICDSPSASENAEQLKNIQPDLAATSRSNWGIFLLGKDSKDRVAVLGLCVKLIPKLYRVPHN